MAYVAESWHHIEKSELRDLAITILALAFAFGWRFSGAPTLGNWAGNFMLVLILVIISVLVHEVVHRLVAIKFHARVHSKLFISAIGAMILVAILTNGWIVIAVPWAIYVVPLYMFRPGKPYPKWHLGPFETALIAVSGPLANFILAVVAKMLVPSLGLVAEKMIFINASLAVFNLLPFLTLIPVMFAKMSPRGMKVKDVPYVEGEFVFFGSRALWTFVFAFVTVGCLSLLAVSALSAVMLAFIVSFVAWVAWAFLYESETYPFQYKDIGPYNPSGIPIGGAHVSWKDYYLDKLKPCEKEPESTKEKGKEKKE
ncbi:MAG: M50 family metallopeptidase [archaeon]